METPSSIFGHMMMAQKITNDNIVALADNLKVVADKVDEIKCMLTFSETPEVTEPTASGTEPATKPIGSNNAIHNNYGV